MLFSQGIILNSYILYIWRDLTLVFVSKLGVWVAVFPVRAEANTQPPEENTVKSYVKGAPVVLFSTEEILSPELKQDAVMMTSCG